jgi:6,7-dimethyl-8-ribityllumazine synthase
MVQWGMQRKHYEKEVVRRDASNLKVGVAVSRFNEDITGRMRAGCLETLRAWGVKERNITVVEVPGSFELPFSCAKLIKKIKPHAVVALGCIIKGDTDHDRYIASAVADGLMRLSIDHAIPVAFGVITTNDLQQAVVRSTGAANKGPEAAIAALESALLKF